MAEALSWAPQKDVYVRRKITTAFATFLILVGLGIGFSIYADWPLLWTVPTSALLTLGFVLDDVLRWRSDRYDRWSLDEGCLTQEGLNGSARIPLKQIANVSTSFGGRVVVELISGERITLHNQRFAAQTAKAILDAKP